MDSGLLFTHDISHLLRYAYVTTKVTKEGCACMRHHSASNFLKTSHITHLAHRYGSSHLLSSSSPWYLFSVPSTLSRTKSAERLISEGLPGHRRHVKEQHVPAAVLPADYLCSPVFAVSAGNAGIGLETVRELAKRDAVVIVGSRRVEKSEAAVGALERDLGMQITLKLSH